jgi:hypothetical protein
LEHWGLINYGINPDVVVPIPKNPLLADGASFSQQMLKLNEPKGITSRPVQGPADLALRRNVFAAAPKVHLRRKLCFNVCSTRVLHVPQFALRVGTIILALGWIFVQIAILKASFLKIYLVRIL